MSDKIRIFTALEIPEPVKVRAREIQGELKKHNCRVSWTQPDGMHLTIKFMGDTHFYMLNRIGSAFADVCKKYKGFDIQLTETGYFGGKRPTVMWLGTSFSDELLNFHKEIDKTAEEFGFKPEKRNFQPHITLGRIRDQFHVARMIEQLKNIELEAQSFTADEMILFKSDLRPAGTVYLPLQQMKFGG